ncbi:uncharacterized protein LOC117652591 isoform X2 [Thrips palmi]|uniref:Uncharacterized protein LOC117652591 isoform X2 n=1 Tax=Thrips palmi TaxID=161013 RepID=A0A6P9AC36_THRPL|nr:uncharacterized protein LOC117652591 isoform X2 [Thrips palmi]
MWCHDCGKTTADVEACVDRGHALCSLGKLRKTRLEQAAPLMLQLEDMVKAELKIMGRLEGAKNTVEELQRECRTRLRQVRDAQKKLRVAMDDDSGDLETSDLEVHMPQGLDKLQDAVSLLEGLEGKCGLWHRDGSQWKGDVRGNRSLLDALVLQLHHNGCITKERPSREQQWQQLRRGNTGPPSIGVQGQWSATLGRELIPCYDEGGISNYLPIPLPYYIHQ